MYQIYREKLTQFTAKQMYDLVIDVKNYHEFVPMCRSVVVHHEDDFEIIATLNIKFGLLKFDFKTKCIKNQYHKICISFVSGPFKSLEGCWLFKEHNDKTLVSFSLNFVFLNKIIEKSFGLIFKNFVDSMVDSFFKRALKIYEN